MKKSHHSYSWQHLETTNEKCSKKIILLVKSIPWNRIKQEATVSWKPNLTTHNSCLYTNTLVQWQFWPPKRVYQALTVCSDCPLSQLLLCCSCRRSLNVGTICFFVPQTFCLHMDLTKSFNFFFMAGIREKYKKGLRNEFRAVTCKFETIGTKHQHNLSWLNIYSSVS